MEFGLSIPTCREGLSLPLPYADLEDNVRMTQLAERFGYASAWANDHITAPAYVRTAYADPPRFYEPLITLAYIAAQTTTIRLGTAVLVVPMREPVFLAKQVVTLDQASGGRIILGVGVGAYAEELEAISPSGTKRNRGEMLAEGVRALRLLFGQRVAALEGKFWSFEKIELYPKPLQDPFPIYIGGNHPNQILRAARMGSGWLPAAMPPAMVREGIARLREEMEAAGRDPSEIVVQPQVMVSIRPSADDATRNFMDSPMFRHLTTLGGSTLNRIDLDSAIGANLIGSPQQIVDKVGEFVEAGVDGMASMTFVSPSFESTLEDIQLFAEEVFPAFDVATSPVEA